MEEIPNKEIYERGNIAKGDLWEAGLAKKDV